MEKVDIIHEYARWGSLDVLENANRYPGPSGFFAYVMEEALKSSLSLIPEVGLRAHFSGDIYIHKLPYSLYIPYCTGHSIARLLKRGLRTPTITSRPAKHFDTFVDHIANYLITLQHYFSGAQAFSSVEWYAGPFIRKENLDLRKVKQNIQRLVYNLNYPTRIGLQTPFTNFTVTLDAPKKMLEGDYAIYNGEEVAPLGEYEREAKMFILALTEVLREGDALGQPFTFPIPTLMVTADMIWNDPEVFEAIFTTAAKRGSFYWLNTNVVDPDASYAMCCRLNIDKREFTYTFSLDEDVEKLERQRFGGLWAMPDVTGSVNVTTVNLPRIALKSRDEDEFWEEYEKTLEIVRITTEWFRNRYVKLLSMYPHMYSMIRDYLEEFPSSHFNTIGILGLPEAAALYLNSPELWKEGNRRDWIEAARLMKRMVEFATEKAREWMKATRVPWNVEEVPGESAQAKLALKDMKDFPELKEYLDDPENPIYSTSIAPYYGPLELGDRIRIEEIVQGSFTGGVMMHIFLGEEPDPEALAELTKKLMKTKLVYWSYTPALTVCNSCKSSFTGLYTSCPKCGSHDVEVWSRIIGYYRPLKNWNPYRKKEFWRRKHYLA
ncbi:anaerobic ribonucleoside-triphosphate reductase [Pyrococcus furiosus DSM 3638]|uniref:Anaerobic ribonucleoside-triphosphate reductase n=1 Tax=Pyrococcus furiosus (strain ATCC 43587 / DSM 3638 / JCM 8422 / Vc1) TaxID=186497 RepID=Q8TZL9_PYRFU|nr:anaerobic ribonucleoside triphosphate reductase [Pyrococcus furiosus]AAL82095.1 anaerobic ribonucleoside-triphosphate reductase [Pyrococcus furiosus DSM 3638]